MDIIKEIAVIIGGTSVAVAAIAWLVKSLTTHLLSKDLEYYKGELNARNQIEIEKLRAELTKQILEHEVRFRRVDENIAEHLAGIYQRLFRMYESVSKYVAIFERSGEPSKDDKLESSSMATREFWDYFLENRVYVPPNLYKRVHVFASKLADIANDFTSGRRREEKGMDTAVGEDHWSKAMHAIKDEANPIFTALVRDVQKLLGVEDIEEESISENPS